jgi:CRISPR-associated protein Cmr2
MSTLVFSIGPVQGFIAQSRRTADGWVGSFLLSYLAGHSIHAIKPLVEASGGRIEEPATDGLALYEAIETGSSGGDTTIASIPNVIIAKLGDSLKADDIGKRAWDEATAKWQEIVGAMWTAMPKDLKARDAPKAVWNRQTTQPWERYWAWGKDSQEAFINLAARKGLRDFDQIAEGGDRCTVCAQREVLWDRSELRGPEEFQNRDVVRRLWRAWRPALISVCEDTPQTLFQPKGKERPCAICLIKRMIPWTENPVRDIWKRGKPDTSMPWVFPSTSTMATNLYRVKLLERALRDSSLCTAIKDYYEVLKGMNQAKLADPPDQFPKWKKFHDEHQAKASARDLPLKELLRLDGDWYLYGPAVKNEHGLSKDEDDAVSGAYQELRNHISKADIGYPPIYWALLTMDGDRMGDFKKACAGQKIDTQQISEKLNEFSRNVPDIVRKKHGRVVYAGGDDVTAFLPLETALDAAEDLRKKYDELFETWAVEEQVKGKLPVETSLSGSIIYAHHQAPLGTVIRQGHVLLTDWAKRRAGRNALAIQIYRRGGPDTTFAARWNFTSKWGGAGPISLATRLRELQEKLISGPGRELARGFAYRLRDDSWMFRAGGPLHGKDNDQAEYVAALLEKSRLGEQANSAAERREMARKTARALLDLCCVAVGEGGSDGLAVEPLLVARFLASGGQEER